MKSYTCALWVLIIILTLTCVFSSFIQPKLETYDDGETNHVVSVALIDGSLHDKYEGNTIQTIIENERKKRATLKGHVCQKPYTLHKDPNYIKILTGTEEPAPFQYTSMTSDQGMFVFLSRSDSNVVLDTEDKATIQRILNIFERCAWFYTDLNAAYASQVSRHLFERPCNGGPAQSFNVYLMEDTQVSNTPHFVGSAGPGQIHLSAVLLRKPVLPLHAILHLLGHAFGLVGAKMNVLDEIILDLVAWHAAYSSEPLAEFVGRDNITTLIADTFSFLNTKDPIKIQTGTQTHTIQVTHLEGILQALDLVFSPDNLSNPIPNLVRPLASIVLYSIVLQHNKLFPTALTQDSGDLMIQMLATLTMATLDSASLDLRTLLARPRT